MLDMTTAELNERLTAATADNRRLRAQLDDKEGPTKIELEALKTEFGKLKSNNADLSSQRDAAMETNDRLLVQLDDKDGEIEKLKVAYETEATKAAEFECDLKREREITEHLRGQMHELIVQRNTWRQVAKWLCKQLGGGKRG